MARVLIAGLGFVGQRLAEALQHGGHSVLGLRRNPTGQEGCPVQAADLRDAGSLTGGALAAGAGKFDAVVFCAAPDHSSEENYQALYVDGVRNLLASPAVVESSAARVLFVSSTSVYGQTDGSWVNETSATEPMGFTGRRTLEAEGVVRSCGHCFAIVRCGGIYGPGRTRLIDSVRRGEATFDSSAPQYTNRIHRDDVAGVLCHLIGLPVVQPLYLAVDDDTATRGVVLRWLATELGVKAPLDQVGSQSKASGNKRCSNQLLHSSGYAFTFPTFREGYRAMIAQVAPAPAG